MVFPDHGESDCYGRVGERHFPVQVRLDDFAQGLELSVGFGLSLDPIELFHSASFLPVWR